MLAAPRMHRPSNFPARRAPQGLGKQETSHPHVISARVAPRQNQRRQIFPRDAGARGHEDVERQRDSR